MSEIRTKLRDWAVWQGRAGCYSQAALSSKDSKTLYCHSYATYIAILGSFCAHCAGRSGCDQGNAKTVVQGPAKERELTLEREVLSGPCIGCLKIVGRKKAANSNRGLFFCTSL